MTIHSGPGTHRERDVHARACEVRSGLPGQVRRERLATASLLYGPLCSLDEVHRRVARTLPLRFGLLRRASVRSIEQAEIAIPDEVLVRYDEAVQLDVFSRFLVLTPAYYFHACGDPWLVAEVAGTERWALLASWRAEDVVV